MKFLIIFVTLTVFASSVISVPANTVGQNLDEAVAVAKDVQDTTNEAANNILNNLLNQLQDSTKNAVDQTNQVIEPVQQLLGTTVDFLLGTLNNNLNNEQKQLLNGLTIAITLDPDQGLIAKITLA